MFGSQTFGFGSQTPFGSTGISSPNFGAPTSTLNFGSTTSAPNIFSGNQTGAQQQGQSFGAPSNISFGTPFGGFGTNQPSFGSNQPSFGSNQPSFGTSQPSFGTNQQFGSTVQGFGTSQPSFGSNQTGFGTGQQGFGSSSQGFGSSASFSSGQQPFGLSNQSTFGTNQQGFGSIQTGFGNPQQGFGSSQSGFGSGFGTAQQPFGGGQQSFGSGQQVFGSGQGFGTNQQAFTSGQQPGFTSSSSFGTGGQGFGTSGFGTSTQSGIGFSPIPFNFSSPSTNFQTNQSSPFGTFGSVQGQPGFSFTNVSSPFSFTAPTNTGFVSTSQLAVSAKSAASTAPNTLSRPILKASSSSSLGTTTVLKLETNLSGGEAETMKGGKETFLPQTLLDCVTGFKTVVNTQKNFSSEISRASLREIKKVTDDTEIVKRILIKLDSSVADNKTVIKQIKSHTVRGLSDCEIAQRTVDLSSTFQSNHPVLNEYFLQVAERFQNQVVSLRLQIEVIERHIQSIINPRAFTPQELSLSLQRVHESFVALAGRMHLLHSSLVSLKNQQLELFNQKITWSNMASEGKVLNTLSSDFNSLPDPSPLFSGGNAYYLLNMWVRRAKLEKTFKPSSLSSQQEVGVIPALMEPHISGISIIEPSTSTTGFPLKPPPSNKRWKK